MHERDQLIKVKYNILKLRFKSKRKAQLKEIGLKFWLKNGVISNI